jgi:hypothetical protein
MELLVAVDDYCVTKIILAASIAGLKLDIKRGVSHDELLALDSAAKSVLLKATTGNITQHLPMLRYIAKNVPAAELMGASAFDSSQVDQWLDFSWSEIGNTHVHWFLLFYFIFFLFWFATYYFLPFLVPRGPFAVAASTTLK